MQEFVEYKSVGSLGGRGEELAGGMPFEHDENEQAAVQVEKPVPRRRRGNV
jgi:hypothetical protein